ncbi:MAG: hypothetical protein DWG82_00465 [Chloroflexi bacterium]|nr:hypothetical protein [Chloroflexota bacterium]MQC48143.1 hypothetical protein [Chloroflexota bacterium]
MPLRGVIPSYRECPGLSLSVAGVSPVHRRHGLLWRYAYCTSDGRMLDLVGRGLWSARVGTTLGAFGYVRPLVDAATLLDGTVQRTALRACAQGESLGPIEIYEEAAEDGRLAFAHLLDAVEGPGGGEHQASTVVAATFAILGASTLERASRLLLLLATGVRVVFADGRSAEDALREGWSLRAGDERRRDRVREGMRTQALRGVVLGRPPFGYVVVDRALSPDPRESPIVQRIFREYVEQGEGLRRIAAGLNRDGIKTRLRRPWTPGSVRIILRNPAYTGLYRRLGVVVPASHPAIIDRATFGVAQRRMVQRRTSRVDQRRHEYAFSGILRCGRCGTAMAGARRSAKAGPLVVYRCANAASRGTCRARAVREQRLWTAVIEELLTASTSRTVAIRGRAPTATGAAPRRLERQLTEAIERWYAGEWRMTELVARVAPIVREHYRDEREPEELAVPPVEARHALTQGWEDLDVAERGHLLRSAVAEVVVSEDEIRIVQRR